MFNPNNRTCAVLYSHEYLPSGNNICMIYCYVFLNGYWMFMLFMYYVPWSKRQLICIRLWMALMFIANGFWFIVEIHTYNIIYIFTMRMLEGFRTIMWFRPHTFWRMIIIPFVRLRWWRPQVWWLLMVSHGQLYGSALHSFTDPRHQAVIHLKRSTFIAPFDIDHSESI